ncbi:SSI family serine proteinase inhibitor [Streptomyces longispororuber]|uniref:SSI family serine proteinase inhibitor n=1 Tax=Streptomyces longispororuber TaxID=68230 RepID=UPI0036FC39A2
MKPVIERRPFRTTTATRRTTAGPRGIAAPRTTAAPRATAPRVAATLLAAASLVTLAALPAAAHTASPGAPADRGTRDHLPLLDHLPAQGRVWDHAAGRDRLTVTFSEGSGTAARTYKLECRPAGGSHPSARAACERLEQLASEGIDPFKPVPRGAMCTQVYGGPQTARVTGTWKGRPVDASFRRTDGCEVGRWNTLVPVLPSTRA